MAKYKKTETGSSDGGTDATGWHTGENILVDLRPTRMAWRIALPLTATAVMSVAAVGVAQAAVPSASVPTCRTSGLTASLTHGLAGGTNHQGIVLRLKNTSGHTCAVRGFPGLGLQDAHHKTLSSHVHWGNTWYAKSPAKKTYDLKNGQSVEAVIAWSHANIGTSGAKHADYLIVTPPAATTHKTIKFNEWVGQR